MSYLLQELKAWYNTVLARLTGILSEASLGTLQLTGIFGLAALLYGLYSLRGQQKPDEAEDRRDRGAGTSGSAPAQTAEPAKAQHSAPASSSVTTQSLVPRVQRSLAWSVKSQLAGIHCVTLSAPGVLLQEWTPLELQESAVLREEAAAVVREMARLVNVFVVAHVVDDVGETTVRGALEFGGLVGSGPGQIPAHRVLFCSTLEGKVSLVRQLEPELHIDGHPHTVEDLKRFMPQLLHIRQPGVPAAGVGSPNVGSSNSLLEVFKDR